MATYKVEIDGGIETVTARTEKEAIRKAARKQGNSKSVGKVFGPKVKVTKIKEEAQMKSFDDIRAEINEAVSPAQQAAIAIAKKEKGKMNEAKASDYKDVAVMKGKGGTQVKVVKDKQGNHVALFSGKGSTQVPIKKMDKKVLQKALDSFSKNGMIGNTLRSIEEKASIRDRLMSVLGEDALAEIFKNSAADYVDKAHGKSMGGLHRHLSNLGRKKGVIGKVGKKAANAYGNHLVRKKEKDNAKKRADLAKKGVSAGMEYEGKKMDPAAMKRAMDAFKKRGGKIKKVAPGKAAGYHGKDDPGDGVQGMMDRGDTKGFNRKKKIGSMK